MNSNERGRITGMPGTQTTVTLYPQTLGVRMRNSIIRMIEAHAITGGWSSNSRKIAERLAEKFGLQCSVMNNYRGMRIVGISETAAPLVAEVVQADWCAWLLENPDYRSGYYRSQFDQTIRSLERCDANFYCNLQEEGSASKVAEILDEHTTEEMKEKSRHIINLLMGTEPIQLITF